VTQERCGRGPAQGVPHPAGWWLAAGVALVALSVYIATLAPALTFEHSGTDGGDLIAAARTLGVPHPTGYPTYTLLAWLFTHVPLGSLAYRVNLLSAVCAAAAVGFFCRSVELLAPAAEHPLVLPAAAALTVAFSSLFWSQAVISEVYALLALCSSVLLWLLIRWRNGKGDHTLWLGGLVLGLGLGNHLTLVFSLPAALLLLWPERRRLFRLRTLLPTMGLFALGLSVYLYLPLAASHYPPVNWGNPSTWQGFWWVVSARQYQSFAFGLPAQEIGNRLANWAALLGEQFGWWGLAIGLVGAWWWWRRDRRLMLFSLTWILPLALYAFFYDTGDSYVYLLPALLMLGLWWSGGIGYLLDLAGHLRRAGQFESTAQSRFVADPGRELSEPRQVWLRVQSRTRLRLALILVGLLPLTSLALHWQQADLSDDRFASTYAQQALAGVAPDSLIVVQGDRLTFALWYEIYAEGVRPDVSVVNAPLLAFIWYRNHVRRLYPFLTVEEPTELEVTTDDLVRDLIVRNFGERPIYTTDPNETWETWFEFVPANNAIYRVQLKTRWEGDG
jgi:hypothetical protein